MNSFKFNLKETSHFKVQYQWGKRAENWVKGLGDRGQVNAELDLVVIPY